MNRVIREFRESPATVTLCASWIVIFLWMAYIQGGLVNWAILSPTARGFGHLTVRDVMAGQVWRTLTATFLHFHVLHLGINLFGLFQLGRVLESWYGSGPFLAVYVIIGVVGNGIAVGLKYVLLGWFPTVAAFRDGPSGGGSSVLCGLIGMLAVVGWRSRTRLGSQVKTEMIGVLAFTAALGLLIPIIDNFGHLGGAIAGALLGLAHKFFLRSYERPAAKVVLGSIATVAIAAAATLQIRAYTPSPSVTPRDRVVLANIERKLALDLVAAGTYQRLALFYGQIAARHPGHYHPEAAPSQLSIPGPSAARLQAGYVSLLAQLDAVAAQSEVVRSLPCHETVRTMSLKVLEAPPTPNEKVEFVRCVNELLRALSDDLNENRRLLTQLTPVEQRP